MIPHTPALALQNTVSKKDEPVCVGEESTLQDTQRQRHRNIQLLLLPHIQRPHNRPRQPGQQKINQHTIRARRDRQVGDAHPALGRDGGVPQVRDGLALEEVQRSAQEADDGEGEDGGPEDELVPGFDDDAEEEEGDAGFGGGDGGDEAGLADDFEEVGFGELGDALRGGFVSWRQRMGGGWGCV